MYGMQIKNKISNNLIYDLRRITIRFDPFIFILKMGNNQKTRCNLPCVNLLTASRTIEVVVGESASANRPHNKNQFEI